MLNQVQHDRLLTFETGSSEAEYNLYKTNIEQLDQLALKFSKDGCNTDRFLFSEKLEENNENQKASLEECIKYSNKQVLSTHFDRI